MIVFPRKRSYGDDMARPKKPAAQRKTFDLRIPVTGEQRQAIEQAAAQSKEGNFAAWARGVLLRAAEASISPPNTKREPYNE